MASQIWYGGGGPPSYAWVRVGSDGRATVITAMQDIGTGTRTAMAQIAAEELGLPLEHVTVVARRLGARPVRGDLRRLVDDAVDGPGRPRGGRRREARRSSRSRRSATTSRSGRCGIERGDVVLRRRQPLRRSRRCVGLLGDAQILGKGARGPNPTGMQVLTFGVQVAEVAVDVETGEVTVDRIAAIHDVGRVINPLGASSQVEGGIIQGIGHTLSEERLLDPRDRARAHARRSTRTGCRRSPTCRRSSASCVDVPDAQLTNLGSKGLGEPPIIPIAAAIANAIRDATGADVRSLPITREEMLRALAEARERTREPWSSCGRLASRRSTWRATGRSSPAGPRSCRCCATAWSTADALVDICGARAARRSTGTRIGAGDDARRARGDAEIPAALREACRLAASPQLRNMGTLAGNLLQSTRCWYWRLGFPCRLHGGDTCHARDGEHREHAIFANDFCASAHPSDLAAALLALGATRADDRRELPLGELYRAADATDDRRTTTLEPGEVILELDVPAPDASVVPEGDGPEAVGRSRSSASPRRGAAARRRVALAGVAPDPVAPRRAARRRRRRSRHGVQGRARAGARLARARSGRLSRVTIALAMRRLVPARAGRLPARGLRRRRRLERSPARPRRRGRRERVQCRRRPSRSAAAHTARSRPRSSTRRRPTRSRSQTNCGSFTIRLDQAQSPNAAASFVALVEQRLLRPHDLPPDRARLRDPGRRPDRRPAPAARATRPSTSRRRARRTRTASSRWRRRRPSRPARPAASSSSSPAPTRRLPPDYAIVGQGHRAGSTSSTGSATLGDANEQPTEMVEITEGDRQTS